jgi:DNA-binding LytR/AlgR family response regulator
MKAVIVEDEYIVAEHLADILTKNHIVVLGATDNLVEAEKMLLKLPDLFLLDIRLSDHQSGIEFGKKLHQLKIPFIYITANNEIETLKKAIATHPETYITKPFKERDVIAAIELIRLKKLAKKQLEIITSKGIELVLESDILYCEAEGSYTKIVTENKLITQRITLKKISEKLSTDFVRIHRSFIVNTQKITTQNINSVYINQTKLPISRSYKK